MRRSSIDVGVSRHRLVYNLASAPGLWSFDPIGESAVSKTDQLWVVRTEILADPLHTGRLLQALGQALATYLNRTKRFAERQKA